MTKDIQNNDVTIQIQAKDLSGRKLRVADCNIFIIHVFTEDPSFYLSYTGRDMLMTEFVDEITIPKRDMSHLKSGVVQYTYHYLPKNQEEYLPNYQDDNLEPVNCPHFHHPHIPVHKPGDYLDDRLINSRPVVTSTYWRNVKEIHNHPHHPDMGMNEIGRVHRLLDIEIANRIKDNNSLNAKIDEEIERSSKEDERIVKLFDEKLIEAQEILKGDLDNNNEEVDNKLSDTLKSVEEEQSRAIKAEADLENKIKFEETSRIGADEVLETKIQMEKERALANETNLTDRISSVSEKFESFKTIQTDALQTEINRSKQVESEINLKIQGVVNDLQAEVSRSAQKDIDHTDLVNVEKSRAEAVENKIATDLSTEVNRAKDAEKHLLDEVHGLSDTVSNLATATNVYTKSEVDNKVNSVKNDVDTVNNWINNHTNDVDALNTKVNGIVADMDKTKSDLLAEIAKCDSENTKQATDLKTLSDSVYTKTEVDNKVSDINSSIASEIAKCDAENDKLSTELKTLSDSVYNKSEVDSKVNDINSAVSALENWKNNHSDNTEGLNEKVTKLIADTEKLSTDLSTETTARINADTTITTKVEVAEGKVDAEAERAKDSEDLIKSEVAELKENATAKHTELSDSIAETNANLTLEIAERKAQDKVLNDALEVINGDVETSGSIKKSLADGKAYTDAEIAKAKLANDVSLAHTLVDYATVVEVDRKISEVIGTAPEALDTLGKISSALSQDSDAISAINEVLSGKANSEDVYNKNDVDTKVTTLTNSLSTEVTNRTNADATINERIDYLVAKVSGIETNVDTNNSTLSDAITAEETARKSADKTIADKLDSEIAKVTEKVTELNAKVIQDIADSTAKDTEIDANISALNTLLTNVESKVDNEVIRSTEKDNELVVKHTELEAKITANTDNLNSEIARSKQVEKELNDKINSIEIPVIDFSEVNSSISSLNDKVDSEISRASAQEKILSDRIDAIVIPDAVDLTPVTNAINTLDNKVDNIKTTLETEIANEATTSRANEKVLNDKIDIINGDKETVGSIAHAVEDAKHHIDDKLTDYYDKATFNEIIDGCATKGALSAIAEELGNTKATVGASLALKANSSDVYTKEEVDQAIADVDVSEQLQDYAKKDECSIIRDENGNKLDLIIDFSDNTPTDGEGIPVYNEGEVDALLSEKANANEVYSKEYIDGIVTEVNSKLNAKLPIDSFNEWSENVATKQEVNDKIDNIEIPDLTEVENDIETINSTLENKADKSEIPSINGLATEDYVNEKIAEIELPETDLSDYYNKSEINDLIDNIEISETDLSDYYTKEQVNSNFASKTQVSAKADAINVYSKNDTYTKAEVNNLIANIIHTYTEEEFEALTDEEKNNGIVIVL